jgi:hypothetical protein
MHTGIISFCDRVGYNIKSSDTKEEILREVHAKYQVQILQRHWTKLDNEGVTQMYRSPHFACLRSNGNPYFMYFTRFDDVAIIYFIDKKIQPGYQVPRIILGRGRFDDALFSGTLLEGEMVKDKYDTWVFLINDVIAYQGEFLWKLTLPQRLEYGYMMLEQQYTPDTIMDVCRFQMKKYAHATKDGVQALIDLSKELPYTSRGLYFWPFARKFKPKLYNFDESLIKTVTRKVKDNPEFREAGDAQPAPAPPHVMPSCFDAPSTSPHPVSYEGEHVFWLRKTENPDVYDIYTSANINGQKEGVALVPTLKASKMLRAEFKEATVAILIPFVCVYDTKWNKWLPVRKSMRDALE